MSAQNVDRIIDNIYNTVLSQESLLDSLGGYSYVQTINFKKLDGNGEIEEQSQRDFIVKVRSPNQRHRELIAASDYEDGSWNDVTGREKNKKYKPESQSHKFSLTEMVSPEQRPFYHFKLIGTEKTDKFDTVHLYIEPIEEDDEKFAGDLWFERNGYALVRAELIPSDNPIGVDSMIMRFEMRPYDGIWLPQKIIFDARISFLFFFKGAIYSEILFNDYHFNQSFADSLFLND